MPFLGVVLGRPLRWALTGWLVLVSPSCELADGVFDPALFKAAGRLDLLVVPDGSCRNPNPARPWYLGLSAFGCSNAWMTWCLCVLASQCLGVLGCCGVWDALVS